MFHGQQKTGATDRDAIIDGQDDGRASKLAEARCQSHGSVGI